MFGKSVLQIDVERETARIVATMREQVLAALRRRGAVLGLSGGIDSSVCAALAVRAFGADKVLALFMPERDSADESLTYGRDLAAILGIKTVVQNIAPVLEAAGCYRGQLEAIQSVVPEYGEGYRFKLVLPSILEGDRLNVTRLTVESPGGDVRTVRLPHAAYLQIVAATNYKQRVRKMTEYYHADRTNFAVIGTPNRLEYDQGFFVKQGDGAADLKPIAHLYKTQVYALAEYLEIPAVIRARPPTTDTFSMPQTQEEFFFALPYPAMDLCLYAFNNGVPASEVAAALELTEAQVERVFRDIEAKRRATRYLHEPPMLVEPVLQG